MRLDGVEFLLLGKWKDMSVVTGLGERAAKIAYEEWERAGGQVTRG